MEKHIEILKNWLTGANEFFNKKYSEIITNDEAKTNHELIEYNEAAEVAMYIKRWSKKLKKMLAGKEMPDNVLKKIETLPNLETTKYTQLR